MSDRATYDLDLRGALSVEALHAIQAGDPITILGKRYICDEPVITYTLPEARAMRTALARLDREEGRR